MPEKVRLVGDPILAQRCADIDLSTMDLVGTIQPLLNSMEETMHAEHGMGLAANQIGRSMRLFILKNDDGTISEYINPIILSGIDMVNFEGEGCLSIPGVSTTTRRYKEVHLSWFDKYGTRHENTFRDMKAYAVQHEMDHLDGKLYVDQFGPVKKDLMLRKHKKYLKELRRK